MRPETKKRLDELERRDKRRKIWLTAGMLAALTVGAGVWGLAYTPGKLLRNVEAVVAQSAVGANEFGQPFHILRVRLPDGRTVNVSTHVKTPITPGKTIALELRETSIGSQYYVWKP